MDYYEELGLRRTASAQEIRQAYKVMARLVHPDGQADRQVRDMAQRQMQRLNEILAILTNEPSRREYDAGLGGAVVVVPAAAARPVRRGKPPKAWEAEAESWTARLPVWAQAAVRNGFWISLALVLVCVGLWYMAQDTGSAAHAGSTPESRPAAEKTRVTRTVEKSAGESKATAEQRTDDESTALSVERVAPAAPGGSIEAPVKAIEAEPTVDAAAPMATSAAPASEAAKAETAAEVATFAGNWVYVPDPAETIAPGNYPATYVELLLAEDRGQLSGSYRAHYRVADRAVSPEVSFQVQGVRPGGKSAHLQWASQDGAKGEVDMALAGPNLMTLSWWSTALGRHATLASGTAKLVRQRTR